MATLQEQISQARAAGYSEDQIIEHLGKRPDMAPKLQRAKEAGYRPAEILSHLGGVEPAKTDKQQVEDFIAQSRANQKAAAVKEGDSAARDLAMIVPNALAGAVRGVGSIGATLLAPIDIASDALAGKGLTLESNRERRAKIDAGLRDLGADPDSIAYKAGKLGGEVAGTAGIGGALANGVRASAPALTKIGMSAPTIQRLANATATSGFSTGAAPATSIAEYAGNMGARMAGGALTGGVSAALVDPAEAGKGALVAAALPPTVAAIGGLGGWAGRSLYSLAQPFTQVGQERLAGKIINRFANEGPTNLNMSQYVPGSTPTLAEATGNAGIARLQSAARDIAPNRFIEREVTNAAARNAAFDDIAGDGAKLDFFRASRKAAADDLYAAARESYDPANMTPYVKGQITQLMKRGSITAARKQAQAWAIERGEKASFDGSINGLHDMKDALDDQISRAVQEGKLNHARILGDTKDKLVDVIERLAPAYREARMTYAEMSKPINQMEVLQGLKLTDQRGNITLSKVQNAINGIEQKMSAPGALPEKSLSSDQLNTLKSIRDDLLRQSNTGLGRSAGSNTFQNIATDNIIGTLLPGKMGEVVGSKAGGAVGQIGKLMYSGPNEAIRNRLVDMMLDPTAGQAAMQAANSPLIQGTTAARLKDLASEASPLLYRGAPVIATDR